MTPNLASGRRLAYLFPSCAVFLGAHLFLNLHLSGDDLARAKSGLLRVFGPGDFSYDQPEPVGF
jgi:hypothetical protein